MRLEDYVGKLEKVLATVEPEGETLELYVDLKNLLSYLKSVLQSGDVRSIVSAWDLVLQLRERGVPLNGIDFSGLIAQLRYHAVMEGVFSTVTLFSLAE